MENSLLRRLSLPVSNHRAPKPYCIELDPALDLRTICGRCLHLPYLAYLDSGLPGSGQGRFSYLWCRRCAIETDAQAGSQRSGVGTRHAPGEPATDGWPERRLFGRGI